MTDELAEFVIKRAEKRKGDSNRGTWESTWQQIRRHIIPIAKSIQSIDTPGTRNRHEILDNSTESVSELLSSALHGFLTNPGQKWFALKAKRHELNQLHTVAVWLERVQDMLYAIFESPDSGFESSIGQVYQELVDFGTGGMYIADDPGEMPFHQARGIYELVAQQNTRDIIDTVDRHYRTTPRAIVNKYQGRAGEKMLKKADNPAEADSDFDFIHAVFPRKEAKGVVPQSATLERLQGPFLSVDVSKEGRHTMSVRGYHEMPFVMPRWKLRAGEIYGRGPGLKALEDVKMLQRSKLATIRAAERAVKPPLGIYHDSVKGPLDLTDDGVTVFDQMFMGARQPPIFPIQTGANPQLGDWFDEQIRQAIQAAYYTHLIQISQDPRMTATQVLKLDEQSLRHLGPFLGRVQIELPSRVIARNYAILGRKGWLPPVPQDLAGEAIEVEYVSPIVKAQRLSEATAIAQTEELLAPMIARNPDVADNLDDDLAYRHVAERLGVPKSLMRAQGQVDDMRRARQEEAERQANLEAAERTAAAAQSAGQAAAAFSGVQQQAA